MRCPSCNAINNENDIICRVCNAKLKNNDIDLNNNKATNTYYTSPKWEQLKGWFSVSYFFITIQEVLFETSKTFKGLKRDNKIFNAFIFGLICVTIGAFFGTFWQYIITLIKPELHNEFFVSNFRNQPAHMLVYSIFIMPAIAACGLFIGSFIIHLCIILTGKTHQTFSVTFKVFAYCQGATSLLNIVPFCGSIASIFWFIYCIITGLKQGHNISNLRAIVAVFLPIIFCCVFCIFIAIALIVSGIGFLSIFKDYIPYSW